MQFKLRIFLAAISVSIGSIIAAPALAVAYTAFDLGTLGGNVTYAYGLNNSGQVVGVSNLPGLSTYRAFVTDANGVGMRDLGSFGGSYTIAYGINDNGIVVGRSETTGSQETHGFVTGPNGIGLGDYGKNFGPNAINASGQVAGTVVVKATNGNLVGHASINMTDLGALGGSVRSSHAYGINASGQVVGVSDTTFSGPRHAFITGANGVGMTDLGTLPGGPYSEAYGINASGQVVGVSAYLNTAEHAFITGANGLGMRDLGTLGGKSSLARGVNASGQVVGRASTSNGTTHAFITGANGTAMMDLNSLVSLTGGDYFVQAMGINDLGQVIANTNLGRAYLISPIPEPKTWMMLLVGLSLVLFTARRKILAA